MSDPGPAAAGNGRVGARPEAVVVTDLHKNFGPLEVLKGISMTACDHDVVSIIGASGSGKSTFLRCINLLELPSRGDIVVNGEAIKFKPGSHGNMAPADSRQVERIRTRLGMVFQSFNLWAHMTVLQNVIEAPVHVLKVPKGEAKDRAEKILNRVGLWEKRDQYPAFLSGGQQQRAAIARALAMEPKVLLMDEPFGALDALTRAHLQDSVMEIHANLGNTAMMVTHDVDEAVLLSDRIVMMTNGPAATIGEVLEVNLPRPRHRLELTDHPEYLRCRAAVMAFLYERHKSPAVAAE